MDMEKEAIGKPAKRGIKSNSKSSLWRKPVESLWIDDPASPPFDQLKKAVSRSKVLSIDTEAAGFYHHYPRLCLLQIAIHHPKPIVFLIDTLAIPPRALSFLRKAFQSKRKKKIFHNAKSDIERLQSYFPNLTLHHVYCTYQAEILLGNKGRSLKDLVHRYAGMTIDKQYQLVDWSVRPIDPEHCRYAILDCIYLETIQNKQVELLKQKKLLRLYQKLVNPYPLTVYAKDHTPKWYKAMKKHRVSDPYQNAFRLLHILRSIEARRLDQTAFRIVRDEQLVEMAKRLVDNNTVDLPQHRFLSDKERSCIEKVWKAYRSQPLAWPKPKLPVPIQPIIRRRKQFHQMLSRQYPIPFELAISKSEARALAYLWTFHRRPRKSHYQKFLGWPKKRIDFFYRYLKQWHKEIMENRQQS